MGLTTTNPNSTPVQAYAGQACVIQIGGRPVLTGWIDDDVNGGEPGSHRLGITGRGKCCDLVDCAAKYPHGQISGANALEVASKLAEPYGITVVQYPGLAQPKPIPQFNLNYGDTAQALIDRVCTYSGLLYYEDEGGDLVLAQVGTTKAASGFVFGQNVERFSVRNSMAGRFSDYVATLVSTATFEDTGDDTVDQFTAHDPNVSRYRNTYLIAEAVTGGQELAKQRALWEASRRAGRGTLVSATADSWRDTAGTLWTPNTLAPVTLPGLRLPAATQLVISEVTYSYDLQGGHTAEVVLMPSAAFELEPIILQPTPLGSGE